jgi:hypothetical protein
MTSNDQSKKERDKREKALVDFYCSEEDVE